LRDVTDLRHPLNLCSFGDRFQGPVRFVTPTLLSVGATDVLYEFDLITHTVTLLATAPQGSEILDHDTSSDGRTAAYELWDEKSSYQLHIVQSGVDTVQSTIQISSHDGGPSHVEFSPSGRYVAFGAPPSSGTASTASVQVRDVAGHLVFWSKGTSELTWAGSGDHLYFDDGSSVKRWDGGSAVVTVMPGNWVNPHASPDRLHVAYDNFRTRTSWVLSPTGGAQISLGLSAQPIFLTNTLVFHDHFDPCPSCLGGPGPYKISTRLFDLTDRTDDLSALNAVFSTWPRGTATGSS
jgi:hypothetical protein